MHRRIDIRNFKKKRTIEHILYHHIKIPSLVCSCAPGRSIGHCNMDNLLTKILSRTSRYAWNQIQLSKSVRFAKLRNRRVQKRNIFVWVSSSPPPLNILFRKPTICHPMTQESLSLSLMNIYIKTLSHFPIYLISTFIWVQRLFPSVCKYFQIQLKLILILSTMTWPILYISQLKCFSKIIFSSEKANQFNWNEASNGFCYFDSQWTSIHSKWNLETAVISQHNNNITLCINMLFTDPDKQWPL